MFVVCRVVYLYSFLKKSVLPEGLTTCSLFSYHLTADALSIQPQWSLAALTLMNIGILSGLSIDNHSLPCVYHHLQLSDNL
jgi:small-conductance mechanosensitive channel